MTDKKIPKSDLPGYVPKGGKNTTSESRENSIKIVESPGLKPEDISFDDREIWKKKYMDLSSDEKILLETQEQTRLIRRISNNLLFYYWLTIIGLVIYIVFYLRFLFN